MVVCDVNDLGAEAYNCDDFIPYFQFTQKYKVILSSLHVDVGGVL